MYQKNLKSDFPTDLSDLCTGIAAAVGTGLENDFKVEAAIVNYYPVGASMGGHLDDAEHTMDKPIISISIGCSAIFLIGGRQRSVKPIAILVRSGDAVVMSRESRYCYHGIPLVLPAEFQPLDESVDPLSLNNLAQLRACEFSLRNGLPTPPAAAGIAATVLPKEVKTDNSSCSLVSTSAAAAAASSSSLTVAVSDCSDVVRYLHQARINMNVRQVRIGDREDQWIDKAGSGASYPTSK